MSFFLAKVYSLFNPIFRPGKGKIKKKRFVIHQNSSKSFHDPSIHAQKVLQPMQKHLLPLLHLYIFNVHSFIIISYYCDAHQHCTRNFFLPIIKMVFLFIAKFPIPLRCAVYTHSAILYL